MIKIWKSDFYRFGKSKLFYGIIGCTCLIAFALMMTIRQDIRIGISVFGNLTAFKGMDDIVRIGVQYQKGLGLLIAVLLSVFIGQEYLWKTWQHKWLIGRSRIHIYLSKAILSSAVSAIIFLLFEMIVLLSSGQTQDVFSQGYISMIICGSFIYAALGSVICMISMLMRNGMASTVVCLGYILFSETLLSIIKSICGFTDTTAKISEWVTNHTIYGMSSYICGASITPESILSIFLNSAIIILLSTVTGIFFFRKYEL